MTTPAKSLAAKLNAISEKIDLGTVRKLRTWLYKFGAPVKVVDSEDGVIHTYCFEKGEEFTVIDWGHGKGSELLRSIKGVNNELQDHIVPTYLTDTNLHAFYAQCVDYNDYLPSQSTILAEFDVVKRVRPERYYFPEAKQRSITLVCVAAAYCFSVYKKSS